MHFFLFFTFSFDQFFILTLLPRPTQLDFSGIQKKKKKTPLHLLSHPPALRGALLPHCHLLLKRTLPLTHIAAPPSLRFTSSQPKKKTPTTPLAFIYIPTLLFSGLCESNTSGEGGGFKMIWANIILF